MHLHRWEEYWDIDYTKLSFNINRVYRYCRKCGRWQKERSGHDWSWWEDSDTPDGRFTLVTKKNALKIRDEVRRQQNAR